MIDARYRSSALAGGGVERHGRGVTGHGCAGPDSLRPTGCRAQCLVMDVWSIKGRLTHYCRPTFHRPCPGVSYYLPVLWLALA